MTSGAYPVSTSLNSNNPLACNNIHIGLNMNLTRLTNYYTKQESDSEFENVSRIQVSGYPHAFSSDQFWQLER